MISRAMVCGRSTILRQIAFKNHQLVRNLFILGLSSVARSKIVLADHHNHMNFISDSIPPAISYSTEPKDIPVVEYAEVKDLPNHPEKFLIDVRKPEELKEFGKIPTSINIPLGVLAQELALSASPEAFKKKYGHVKPDANSYIIVHCRSGKRSQQGAEIAQSLGYKKVHNYVGSWLDWAEREGLPK